MFADIDSLIKDWLTNKKILILDDQQGSRTAIKQFFIDKGAHPNLILATKSFSEAVLYNEVERPQIIVSEYEIGTNFGLELVETQQENYPNFTERIFLIASTLAEMSSVADSAEEGVDAFIVKPVSETLLTKYLLNALDRKANPSEYVRSVMAARRAIDAGELQSAEHELRVAALLIDESSSIHYLKGQICERRNQINEAIVHYDKALKLNPNFFKCVAAKLNLLTRQKRFKESYTILQFIRRRFPLTPEVLKNALVTVVMSYQFLEVDEYFNVYLTQRRKPEDLKFLVSLSFLTAGKMLLKSNRLTECLVYFKKGALVSGRQTEYLEDVVKTLIDAGEIKACRDFFSMFEPTEISQNIITCIKFRIMEHENRSADELLNEARKLVFDRNADLYVSRAAIRLSRVKGNIILLESLVATATELFPKQVEEFKKLAFNA